MDFSYSACAATVILVAISGLLSFTEGTFSGGNVTMGFVQHGGMWGDLLILSVVNGFVFPHLTHNFFAVASALAVSTAVTIAAHAWWAKLAKSSGATNHIFPYRQYGVWYYEISMSGWFHIFTMTLLLTVLLLY